MNCISVREFELLTKKELMYKMSAKGIEYKDSFEKLITFIEEFSASPENEDAYQFMCVKKNRQHGQYITFRNYVGLIELNDGLQIEILPKIEMDDNEEKTKSVFLKMLRSMKDFDGKVFNISNLKSSKMNLYEIFISLYLQEASRLVKKGLRSSYNSDEDNITVLKGKLKIKEQLTKNLTHKDKFYVSFDEYTLNRPENRLIKTTLLFLIRESKNNNNKKLGKQLLEYFETVDISYNIDADLASVNIDRTTKEYDTIIQWSKVYLKHKSFTTFSGQSKSKALLFPMERLFESYVARNFRNVMSDVDCKVLIQDSKYHLFDSPKEFKIKPDIVVETDNCNVVLDTKWKKLYDSKKDNYGISQSDMYQMYAYSKKYGDSSYNAEVYLLYPLNKEMRDHEQIDYTDLDGVKVHIRFIDLSKNIIDELSEIKKEIMVGIA